MKCRLTTKMIGALELPAGKSDVIVWDSEVAGFGLRIRNRTGVVTKSWVAQKKRNRRAFKIAIGGIDVVTLDQARRKAVTELAKIALGEDPAAERAKDRHLMKALVPDYLAHQELRIRPRSYVEMKRYLTGDYFRPLHGLPVDAIRRGDVSKRVVEIERERGSATARESRTSLSGFFSWAMQMGFIEANPTLGSIKPAETVARDRVLDDNELAAIWNACNGDDHGKIVRLLILLGQRRSEIGGIAWSELRDLDGPHPTWMLPSTRAKNKREHVLPLPAAAVEIIATVPKVVGRDRLFGIRNTAGFCTWNEGKKALDKRLGDKVGPWHLHDLRRTFSTRLNELGAPPWIVEAILNHSRKGMEGVYNKAVYRNQMRDALVMWADHVRALVGGGERKLLPFPQTA